MSVVDDLKAAKAAIETFGWTKGTLADDDGRLCTIGAVNLACAGSVYMGVKDAARRDEARSALTAHLPQRFRKVAEFNDHSTTTKQDVLDLFSKTIANLGGMA